jgi:hypothetical protein
MAERKAFLLRLSQDLWEEIQRLAEADLRSANAQMEVLLREAVRRRKRERDTPEPGDGQSR